MSSTTLLTLLNNRSMLGAARGGEIIPVQESILDINKDTFLNSGASNRNNGASTYLGFGGAANPSLLYFDFTDIPIGSSCESANLHLFKNGAGGAAAFVCTLYAIKQANGGWNEGTKDNDIAGNGEPSWDNKDQGAATAWAGSAGLSSAGTDYEIGAIGSFTGDLSDPAGTEYIISLNTMAIEAMFGNSANYGILAKWSDGTGSLASRQNATVGYRPKLTVNWKDDGGGGSATYTNFFCIGDSKAAQFAPDFKIIMDAEGNAVWGYYDGTCAGKKVTEIDELIAGLLASIPVETIDYAMVNMGINDTSAMPDEATFTTAYQAVIDAIHTHSPGAWVGCMRIGARGAAAACATLNGWIATAITGRSWAHLGPDESVFLEGGDDYTTYTSDGTHLNDAGKLLEAQQWAALV